MHTKSMYCYENHTSKKACNKEECWHVHLSNNLREWGVWDKIQPCTNRAWHLSLHDLLDLLLWSAWQYLCTHSPSSKICDCSICANSVLGLSTILQTLAYWQTQDWASDSGLDLSFTSWHFLSCSLAVPWWARCSGEHHVCLAVRQLFSIFYQTMHSILCLCSLVQVSQSSSEVLCL